MLEFQTQYPPEPIQPEPIFPDLVPLEQDPPEDYNPDEPDNSGHFPADSGLEKQQAQGLNKAQVMFNIFGLYYNEMVLKPKAQKLPAEEIREGDGQKPIREPNGEIGANKGGHKERSKGNDQRPNGHNWFWKKKDKRKEEV